MTYKFLTKAPSRGSFIRNNRNSRWLFIFSFWVMFVAEYSYFAVRNY